LIASLLGVVPIKQEHPLDCAIAVTIMVLDYYGLDTSNVHDEMRGDIPESQGLRAEKISDNLNSKGLFTEWKVLFPFEFVQFIKSEIKGNRPTIVILKSGRISYHTVVVIGIDEERIYYINPTTGKIVDNKIKDFTNLAITDYGIFTLQIKNEK